MKRFLFLALATVSIVASADPDPKVMTITREQDIKWVENPANPGMKVAVLYGNPPQPGPYIIRVRFPPGTMSMPHFHAEARQITVLKGTWWVGAGPKWDRNATTPMPVGSFVVHHANQIHYDGAKDEEVIVQISGIGTNGATPVDETGKPK